MINIINYIKQFVKRSFIIKEITIENERIKELTIDDINNKYYRLYKTINTIDIILPMTLIELYIHNIMFKDKEFNTVLPPNLTHLDIYFSGIEKFNSDLPPKLKLLFLIHNELMEFNKELPSTLIIFWINNNKIKNFSSKLPDRLQSFNIYGNNLYRFNSILPPKLKEEFDIGGCFYKLKKLKLNNFNKSDVGSIKNKKTYYKKRFYKN